MKKKISGIPPLPPQAPKLTLFWADKSQNGPFNPQGFVLQFWNFAWPQKYEDSNEEEKISGTPHTPQITLFWADKSQNGPFHLEGFVVQVWKVAGGCK